MFQIVGDQPHWADVLTAFMAVGSFAANIALAAIAWFQIDALRNENKKQRTLDTCARYEGDPAIVDSRRKLRIALKDGKLVANPEDYRTELVTLMNYLDLIAIGIKQGLFLEEIVRDHMESIFEKNCEWYLRADIVGRLEGVHIESEFKFLSEVLAEWKDPDLRYSEGQKKRLKARR